jgi:hypothetical protein
MKKQPRKQVTSGQEKQAAAPEEPREVASNPYVGLALALMSGVSIIDTETSGNPPDE